MKQPIRAAALLLAFGVAFAAQAQTYPNRPLRLIVSQAAGGAPDIVARLLAERLSRGLGQNVAVDNRPGGANVIGAQAVARAPADGYTYFFATAAPLVTNPYTFKNLPYDPVRDFVPVGTVGKAPFFFMVNANVQAKTLAELIALDRRDPGKLTFATDGPRNFSGMVAAWFNKLAGTNIVIAPYAAMPQGVQDTVAGRTQVTVLAIPVAVPFIKRGDLRVIAQTTAKRAPGYEDIPTIAETFPGFEFVGWFAVVAPAGTPAEAIARVNQEMDRALKDAEVVQRLRSMGIYTDGADTPAGTGEFIRAERERWGRVIHEIGIQPE